MSVIYPQYFMGGPAFEHEAIFSRHGISVFSANFALYGDMSKRVMSIVAEYSPETEVYSIDECFLKLKYSSKEQLLNAIFAMKKSVQKWTGIPISIGVAPTKSLAKAVNKIAKKFQEKTNGVLFLETDEQRIKALKWLKIEDVWGIGSRHAVRLRRRGVETAYDFIRLDDAAVKKMMTIVGLRLKQDLQGMPILNLEDVQPKKSIAMTRSFAQNYTLFEQVEERVVTFAVGCAEKLRLQHSHCNSMCVFLRTNRHREDLPQYSRSILLPLPYPTNSSIELADFAVYTLRHIFKEGYAYKKAGVIVQHLTPENAAQQSLFYEHNEKHQELMKVMDHINGLWGRNKLRLASQGVTGMGAMRREKISPQYTTNIDDIITINNR